MVRNIKKTTKRICQNKKSNFLNCGVLQGFLTLRKAETAHVWNYANDYRVFDTADQLLTRQQIVVGLLCLYNKQNDIWLLAHVEFLFSYSTP